MFWALLILISLAVALIKLGAMSVWLTVLLGALQALVFGAVALIVFAGWRYWKSR